MPIIVIIECHNFFKVSLAVNIRKDFDLKAKSRPLLYIGGVEISSQQFLVGISFEKALFLDG